MRGWAALAGVAGLVAAGCSASPQAARPGPVLADPEAGLRSQVERQVHEVALLSRQLNLAYWKAATTGEQAAWQAVAGQELALRRLYADPLAWSRLRQAASVPRWRDALLERQVIVLEAQFHENQIDPALLEQLTRATARLERAASGYRPSVLGRPVGIDDVYQIMRVEPDVAIRRAAWQGLIGRGAALREELLALVRLRNRAARTLGFADHHQLRLRFDELDPAWLQALVDRLARETDPVFGALVPQLQARAAERFGLRPGDLRPWHFEDPTFQSAGSELGLDLDPLFEGIDPTGLVETAFGRAGLKLDGVFGRSDLVDRPGKLPQAFCLDVDRAGDVRILANLQPGERWTATLLHEAGHAAYRAGISPDLPWLLRTPAHEALTEAVAVLFARLTRDPSWLEQVAGIAARRLRPRLDELDRLRRTDELLFLRWCLLMVHFERELYRDPDQDLDRLWWELKQRYQGIAAPPGAAPSDWAAQLHLVLAPVYYHNYLLGQLLASQLERQLASVGPDPLLRPDAGLWLRERIFAPGASLRWDELVQQATGESLDPAYHIARIVGSQPATGQEGKP